MPVAILYAVDEDGEMRVYARVGCRGSIPHGAVVVGVLYCTAHCTVEIIDLNPDEWSTAKWRQAREDYCVLRDQISQELAREPHD